LADISGFIKVFLEDRTAISGLISIGTSLVRSELELTSAYLLRQNTYYFILGSSGDSFTTFR